MMFDFSTPLQLKITMYQYVDEIINGADEVYKSGASASTPAPIHLYSIRDPETQDISKLNTQKSIIFIVMKLLVLILN